MPPDSSWMNERANPWRWTSSRCRSAIARRSEAARCRCWPRPKLTLSMTFSQGNSAGSWKIITRSGPGPATARPSTMTCPVVGGSNPATRLSSVVLPQPDGPTRTTISPSRASRSTGPSASRLDRRVTNRFVTPLRLIFAVAPWLTADGACPAPVRPGLVIAAPPRPTVPWRRARRRGVVGPPGRRGWASRGEIQPGGRLRRSEPERRSSDPR